MNYRIVIVLWIALLLTGCEGIAFAAPDPTVTESAMPSRSVTTAPQQRIPSEPLPTATATVTPTLAPTFTPPSLTPTWVAQGPDQVQVPILMYHHIAVSPIDSRWYVSPVKFDEELRLLHNWGYTTISTSLLVQAITQGASLPPHPIILTFDDANEDTFTNAFPIMKKYGFTGVLYVPYDYIGANGYLTVDQIKEMAAAGWEIGSHTLSHPMNFLFLDPPQLRSEIVDSRKKLENLLGLPVLTFAYPFGDAGNSAVDYVKFAGYIAAMGATGFTADQGKGNLFLLQRCEIKSSEDAKTMTRFLPWLGDPSYLPTDTPTPTPTASRTPIPTYTHYPTRTPKVTSTP